MGHGTQIFRRTDTDEIEQPLSNGKAERMNRTIKEATVCRYYDDTHEQRTKHLANFVDADNYAKRLKTLKGLTPYKCICKQWTNETKRSTLNPIHQNQGLNILRTACRADAVIAFVDDHLAVIRQTFVRDNRH